MKQLKQRVGAVLGFIVITAALAVLYFILNSSGIPQPSAGDGPIDPIGYPAPSNGISGIGEDSPPDPYPAPGIEEASSGGPFCDLVGNWLTYTDEIAGYSVEYPAESDFRVSPSQDENYRSVSIYLQPSCYGQECWGTNRVIITVIDNPNKLPIDQFVEVRYEVFSDPDSASVKENYLNSKSFMSISGVTALRFEDGLTSNKPEIYIPNGDQVIKVYVSNETPVPPFPEPCPKTLELLESILTTIVLNPVAEI